MQVNQNPREALSNASDISPLDILHFLKRTYKTILIFGTLGLVAAIIYLVVVPKKYSAVAQIAMAQISTNTNSSNNINPLGVNIEEPALLVFRLSLPTSFTPQALSACGLAEGLNSGDKLAKSIKLTIPKGVANLVELKTFSYSPQTAQHCAGELFELIKITQAQIVAPYINEAKANLLDNEARLARARDFVAKADKSGASMGASYLSTRDEIRSLLDEIAGLRHVVSSSPSRVTRLIAPIYASETPATPKRDLVLAVGILGGLIAGLLFALGSQLIASINNDQGGIV